MGVRSGSIVVASTAPPYARRGRWSSGLIAAPSSSWAVAVRVGAPRPLNGCIRLRGLRCHRPGGADRGAAGQRGRGTGGRAAGDRAGGARAECRRERPIRGRGSRRGAVCRRSVRCQGHALGTRPPLRLRQPAARRSSCSARFDDRRAVSRRWAAQPGSHRHPGVRRQLRHRPRTPRTDSKPVGSNPEPRRGVERWLGPTGRRSRSPGRARERWRRLDPRPAAWCGLVGLKPSRGRTPVGPLVGEAPGGLPHEFAVSRTVRDAAGLLDAVSGPSPGDHYYVARPSRSFATHLGEDPGRLRIAMHTRSYWGRETGGSNGKPSSASPGASRSWGTASRKRRRPSMPRRSGRFTSSSGHG